MKMLKNIHDGVSYYGLTLNTGSNTNSERQKMFPLNTKEDVENAIKYFPYCTTSEMKIKLGASIDEAIATLKTIESPLFTYPKNPILFYSKNVLCDNDLEYPTVNFSENIFNSKCETIDCDGSSFLYQIGKEHHSMLHYIYDIDGFHFNVIDALIMDLEDLMLIRKITPTEGFKLFCKIGALLSDTDKYLLKRLSLVKDKFFKDAVFEYSDAENVESLISYVSNLDSDITSEMMNFRDAMAVNRKIYQPDRRAHFDFPHYSQCIELTEETETLLKFIEAMEENIEAVKNSIKFSLELTVIQRLVAKNHFKKGTVCYMGMNDKVYLAIENDQLYILANDFDELVRIGTIIYDDKIYLTNAVKVTPKLKVSSVYGVSLTEGLSIDEDGTVKITFNNKSNYMDEYSRNHKMLKSAMEHSNFEEVKLILAYDFALIDRIETILKGKTTGLNDKEKEMMKARAFLMNDFKTYLTLLRKQEPKFNFAEYYDKCDAVKKIIKIDSKTINGIKLLLRNILLSK